VERRQGLEGGRTALNTSTNHEREGRVVVISGPSGVGKSTLCHRLCRALPAEFSVSMTTRAARPGERDGVDYQFVAAAEFQRLVELDGFIEHAEVYGCHYGTPVGPVLKAIEEDRWIVLEIDINGAIQVRSRFPGARLVFLLPPTPEEQRRRIEGRASDSEEEIAKRLSRAESEIRTARASKAYDVFVVNDDPDHTFREVCTAVRGH
jgi:guanylate kinase